MNTPQIIYAIWLASLVAMSWHRQRYAVSLMLANLCATLAACYALDEGVLSRDDATLAMLLIDLCTGTALALRAGTARLLAWGYAITVPLYALNIIFGVQISTTFGIIYLIAYAQLGVLTIGAGGGGNYRGVYRRLADLVSMGTSRRHEEMPSGAAPSSAENR